MADHWVGQRFTERAEPYDINSALDMKIQNKVKRY